MLDLLIFLFKILKIISTSKLYKEDEYSNTSLIYEKQINDIFYSQFNSHIEGLNYINENIGFFKIQLERSFCVVTLTADFYKNMPTSSEIKSIHFLNLSQYTQN